MGFSRAWRLGGFVAALGASGALIATATSGTGAYFTDVHGGSIHATSGHLTITTHGTTSLDFTGLLPGVDQTKQIGYTTNSNGKEDVWLVFPRSNTQQEQSFAQFTGAKNDPAWTDGGLGRYGHFAVSDTNGGLAFQTYNLAYPTDPSLSTEADYTKYYTGFYPTALPAGESCQANAAGRGGSSQQATSPSDTPPWCGVPTAIKLASNLASGSTGTVTVTFGLTGRQTQQNQTEFPDGVSFQIVATQAGVRPDAANY